MGKRLLRAWLLRPSIDLTEINARLDAVEAQTKADRRTARSCGGRSMEFWIWNGC